VKNYPIKKLIQVCAYPIAFLAVLWIIFLIKISTTYNFAKFGVLPRELKGLHGIVTSALVHENLDHILSNSFPLLVLGCMLFFFYQKVAKQAFVWMWLISGIWLWIGGRNHPDYPTYHLGASTLIYGLATFLFFSGVIRKHLRLMVVSALVVFLYGSIMWGIFPLKQDISWEGHLFGAISGVLVAFHFRKEGPQREVYEWESEEADDDVDNSFDGDMPLDDKNDISINYIYKQKEDFKDDNT
jgi:membrane associated rhomboid family serine protease